MSDIKIKKEYGYCTIPSSFLSDEELSLEAMGLMALLYSDKAFNNEDEGLILERANVDKKKLAKVLEELCEAGYIEKKRGTFVIKTRSGKKKDKVKIRPSSLHTKSELEEMGKAKKKQNLWEQITEEINNYTEDTELRTALFDYAHLRTHTEGTRLEGKPIKSINMWKRLLSNLSKLKGNKVDIVNTSILNCWSSFFELKEDKSAATERIEMGNVTINRMSKEEIEEIKKKAKKY